MFRFCSNKLVPWSVPRKLLAPGHPTKCRYLLHSRYTHNRACLVTAHERVLEVIPYTRGDVTTTLTVSALLSTADDALLREAAEVISIAFSEFPADTSEEVYTRAGMSRAEIYAYTFAYTRGCFSDELCLLIRDENGDLVGSAVNGDRYASFDTPEFSDASWYHNVEYIDNKRSANQEASLRRRGIPTYIGNVVYMSMAGSLLRFRGFKDSEGNNLFIKIIELCEMQARAKGYRALTCCCYNPGSTAAVIANGWRVDPKFCWHFREDAMYSDITFGTKSIVGIGDAIVAAIKNSLTSI